MLKSACFGSPVLAQTRDEKTRLIDVLFFNRQEILRSKTIFREGIIFIKPLIIVIL